MGSKPDFTQKLLNDLRLRKQRMAGGQQSSEAFRGSSRDIFKQSKGVKTIQTNGQKNGSTHRSFSSSHTTTQQSVNQIVPYEGGHQSSQKGDISMAIACAFDNGGNLKAFELQSNAAMVNLLQQIGKRSMQQTSTVQWQSTNQFPTLTHLKIDEVARGAQKLNQILKTCTGGLNIGKGSVEVGKELWKGATELEQSLRMLVSLQEASNCMIKPQRKSRLKLLEEGEDFDDDDDITAAKQKQVERPVFSFDKPSKNTKGSIQTELPQNQPALRKDLTTKPEKEGSMISKGSHRRSASCGPEFQLSQQIISSKPKQSTARLPNVIAKLMGLEEIPTNADPKQTTEVQTQPKHRSSELVLRTSYGNSRSAELKAEDTKSVKLQVRLNRIESTKIALTAANSNELQEEKAYEMTSMTDNYFCRTTHDPQKSTWKEERVGNGNCVKDSEEAIFKVNELLSQMIQPRGRAGSPRNTNTEPRVSTETQRQEVTQATETLQRTVEVRKRGSEDPQKMQEVSTGTCNTHEAGDRVANEQSVNQQKNKTDNQLQPKVLPTFEPQGKKPRAENISKHIANNKSQQRKKADHPPKPNNIQIIPSHSKNMQMQQNATQSNADGGRAESNALLANKQNHDPATRSVSTNSNSKETGTASPKSGQNGILTHRETQKSDFKEKSPSSLKSGQNGASTKGETDSLPCTNLNIVAKSANVSGSKVAAEPPTQKRNPNLANVKANEIMAITVKTATKTVRRKKPQKQIMHGQRPKKLEKLIVSGGEAKPSDRTSKSTQAVAEPCGSPKHEKTQKTASENMGTTIQPKRDESGSLRELDEQEIAEQHASLKHEETQAAESKHMGTTNQHKGDELYSQQDLEELPPSNRNVITAVTAPDSEHGQQLVADKDHKAKPQKIPTDGHKDEASITHNAHQQQQRHPAIVNQEPLTEDQINLKQKLIQSHLFLNTAEALFKLHIPIGLLNYASDQMYNDKDSNLILDCGYELLKKKGRRKEMSLYPNIGKVMKCTEVRSLDNLVRQMHEDFETLRSYGRSEREEYDEVEYLLKMLERDIFYRVPDLNCMWDLGWNEMVFAYADRDEVVRDVEQSLLDGLLGEIVADWL